jgi:cell division protein FtsW (lipid II flippase)
LSPPDPRAGRLARRELVLEATALLLVIAGAWIIGERATSAWLARVAVLPEAIERPAADVVRGLARGASLWFSAGVVVLALARAASVRRARALIPGGWLLPALAAACLLGLTLQHATVEVVGGEALLPTAPGFAQGFFLASLGAAAILVAPFDVEAVARRAQLAAALAIAGIFVALAVAGSGPGGSGTRINLGPVQPIEAVKLATVLLLAAFLGQRAGQLRWHRRKLLGLRWPRLELMAPALAALVAIFAGLFIVGDLGPVLLLAALLLAMFYLVTRASGWVAAALGVVGALLLVMHTWPGLVNAGRVATRIRIWKDPWGNGLTHGHQVGEGLWAVAAGGPTGQGLAETHLPLPPAAKTDLVLTTLMEQLGLVGLLAYLALLALIVVGGLRIAARSRTPVRVLLAGGASMLLVVQWAVIHAGSFGQLPLTGIVAPFLSSGRSSMVVFVALVALLVRLAADGPAREETPELAELHLGARRAQLAALALVGLGVIIALGPAWSSRPEVAARGLRVTLADGTRLTRHNPRLVAIAAQIRRGTLEDRHGEPLARSAAAPGPAAKAARQYPLGAALGTLLGTAPSKVLLPPWALERLHDRKLAGADLLAYAPVIELPRAERAARIRALDEDVASRSVRITLDARLQREVAALLAAAVRGRPIPAAAAVLLDVDSGQILARAQVPDLDPADPSWQALLLEPPRSDEARLQARGRFTGAYGPWSDRTGVHGMFQAGSIAKLFTALAAVRSGLVAAPAGEAAGGSGCRVAAPPRYACTERDAQGPLFTRPGWPNPVHDHSSDPTHGEIDLARALAVSCNVYFAQLGLALGPAPLAALRAAGVDIGYRATLDPGEPGSRQLASSAFGQGAMAMSPLAAARLAAALAAGGRYRRCPKTMELAAACPETSLVDDPAKLAPILAGMRQVMTEGTGRRLAPPAGVRVYAKTGTADAGGFAGEEPFGIVRASDAPPHSWLVGFAEPAATPECASQAPGRLAFAVVVPRGGSGAATAGPLAMKLLAAATSLGYLGGAAAPTRSR